MFVSKPISTPPENFKSELQQLVYEKLAELWIPFERVECDDGTTMDACREIDSALNCKTVKTLFLCNRRQTVFYLFVTEGDKPFVTKNFSKALEVSRCSFAPEEKLFEFLSTKIGATTIFSCFLESSEDVNLVIDKDVLDGKSFCCTDGTHTGFVCFSIDDFKNKFLPALNRDYKLIEV